jgi:hypothetical protein
MRIAASPAACFEIVFQIAVSGANLRGCREHIHAERGAAKIRVQYDAGGVYKPAQVPNVLVYPRKHHLRTFVKAWQTINSARKDAIAERIQNLMRRLFHALAPDSVKQCVFKKTVHFRQTA